MKKYIAIIAAAIFTLCACEEFEPVFTGKYAEPAPYEYYDDDSAMEAAGVAKISTISELAAMYTPGTPLVVDKEMLICGRVSTTDQPGNFYKSFYIQDETGGIEIKMGKNGLYNDYLPGQKVYVDLMGLTVGMYGYKSGNYGGMGMVQVGFSDPTGDYETSYIESQIIIDSHILRGDPRDIKKVIPVTLSEEYIPDGQKATQANDKYVGSLVTLKNLTYGKEVFCLLYLDQTANKKLSSNRIFLSDKDWGITTWAMSESKMKENLCSGIWDAVQIGNANDYKYGQVGDEKYKGKADADGKYSYPGIEKAAYSVSQYFKLGSKDIIIRTSGYSKFCDKEIPYEVLDGLYHIDVTGVLTFYQGDIQLVLNSLDDVIISETGKKITELPEK